MNQTMKLIVVLANYYFVFCGAQTFSIVNQTDVDTVSTKSDDLGVNFGFPIGRENDKGPGEGVVPLDEGGTANGLGIPGLEDTQGLDDTGGQESNQVIVGDPGVHPDEQSPGEQQEYPGDTEAEEQQRARDVVDTFLSIVEQYERNKDNCTPGTEFNLGEGVVAQYGVLRYKAQAMVAVNRANFLTRLWKGSSEELLDSEFFVFTAVRSMVEGDPDLFAAGNCYNYMEYKNYTLFCPYAYRTHNDSQVVMVKDLSVEYKYLTNSSEFFWQARLKADSKLLGPYNETKGRNIHSVHKFSITFQNQCKGMLV